jgi:Zn-dependent M32 family carboxypeptidase
MEDTETKLLKLTRAVCRLHRYEEDAFDAIETLADEGFENVSVAFVEAVYNQLEKEADKLVKIHREKAENTLYYTFVEKGYKSVFLLSERFFLLYDFQSTDPTAHKLELFDLFNDKSM